MREKREAQESRFLHQARRRQDFEARIVALQGERGDKAGCLSHKRASRVREKREAQESRFLHQARRRQDFEARIVALQGERGDKAGCLSHKRAAAIHDSSPKANAKTKPNHKEKQ